MGRPVSCELSLDLQPRFTPKSITDFLKNLSPIKNVHEKSSKLNDYIKMYEEEMRKIDAFKRELPLCMRLLNDAIAYLRYESVKLMDSMTVDVAQEPILEGFVPLSTKECNVETELKNDEKDKDKGEFEKSVLTFERYHPTSEGRKALNVNSDFANAVKNVMVVGESNNCFAAPSSFEKSVLTFERYHPTSEGRKALNVNSDFANVVKNVMVVGGGSDSESNNNFAAPSSNSKILLNYSTQLPQPAQYYQQTACRKPRRCWSVDLHRRFVNALEQLGGSQAATPKQIRELMQVDGLTNDEVKSHLQKYRLHRRKHSTGARSFSPEKSSVLFGELSNSHGKSKSSSPQGPYEFDELDGMEDDDDEDEKTENYCWKNCTKKPVDVL